MNNDSPEIFIHASAVVDDGAVIGSATKIWHFSHICAGAVIGERCSFGQNTMVADGVKIGSNTKVQNNVAIYEGTIIEEDVFLGPSCVLTNVSNPRSQVVRRSLYEKTVLRRGCTIGANSTILCGITIGRYAFVAAGAVVTSDVPDYSLVKGVPAKHTEWVSRHGHPLVSDPDGMMVCPESRLRYRLENGGVHCLDIEEERPLPDELSTGQDSYRAFSPRTQLGDT